MIESQLSSDQLVEVLNSPPETWAGTGFDAVLRHQFYRAAAQRIRDLEQQVARSRIEGLVECMRAMQAQRDWVAIAQVLKYLPRDRGIIQQKISIDSHGRVIVN